MSEVADRLFAAIEAGDPPHPDRLRAAARPAADGTRAEVPACLVVTCAGGRITRLEEYLDSAHVARLTSKE